jgi:hypothetical protein
MALVRSPHALLVALVFWNAILAAGIAGIVLVPYAIVRARRDGAVDRHLAVAAGLLVPGLLVAAIAGFPAGTAGAAFAVASVGLYVTRAA